MSHLQNDAFLLQLFINYYDEVSEWAVSLLEEFVLDLLETKKVSVKDFNIVLMETFETMKDLYYDQPRFLPSMVKILKEIKKKKLMPIKDVLQAIKPRVGDQDEDYLDFFESFMEKADEAKLFDHN